MALISVEETINTIRYLENLDLEICSDKEVRHHLRKICNIPVALRVWDAGTVICRAVKVNSEKFQYKIDEISYNPNLESCNFNRASLKRSTAFYGSITSNVIRGSDNPAFEILPLPKKNSVGIKRYALIIGKWVLQKRTEFLSIGGGESLAHLCEAGRSRNEFFIDKLKTYPDAALQYKIIDSFLARQFSKEVSDKRKFEYRISATYAQMIRELGIPGIVYPSVKSNGAGLNIALFPDAINQGLISLEFASLCTYYVRDSDIVNEYTLIGYPKEGFLQWKDGDGGRIDPAVKAYYTGRSNFNPIEGKVEIINLDHQA